MEVGSSVFGWALHSTVSTTALASRLRSLRPEHWREDRGGRRRILADERGPRVGKAVLVLTHVTPSAAASLGEGAAAQQRETEEQPQQQRERDV